MMEYPVFFDKSGKRWKTTKIMLLAVLLVTGGLTVAFLPGVLSPMAVPAVDSGVATRRENRPDAVSLASTAPFASGAVASAASPATLPLPSPSSVVAAMRSNGSAIIGAGPLMRIIEVRRTGATAVAYDPFSGRELHAIRATDAGYIGNDRYALERYGKTDGKRLVLTYDDGPDALYTPELLDLLSREGVRATFFAAGGAVVQNQAIAKRIVREGHAIGNHTFTHKNLEYLSPFMATQEVNQTNRVIAATTGVVTPFFRIPYGGDTDESFREHLTTLAYAQQLGYTVTSYGYDTNDWQFSTGIKQNLPKFDGSDVVVLLHDGGGDRSQTVAYTKRLIGEARKHGYGFANVADIYPVASSPIITAAASVDNTVTLKSVETVQVWPKRLVWYLFGFTIIMMLLTTVLNIVLASVNRYRSKRRKFDPSFQPSVAIIVPAYNEGRVIINTIRSLLRSRYRKIRIIIVDDGSTDDTWKIARSLALRYRRVSAIHQENGGKSSALNNAIAHTSAEVVICVDADTVFPNFTVGNLVRHFHDEKVGAVAGVIKVGNVKGMLTRWQALEYATSISLDRNAQSLLGSIMIVPGACGAWRRSAILEAGGFSHVTLAEDCDLTLKIQRLCKYKIVQENEAVSYTEAPEDMHSFAKQRFRWMFGNVQALWRQRDMIDNPHYGMLGCLTMPIAAITVVTPILFWPLLIFLTYQNIISGNILVIIYYFLASLVLQIFIAVIGLILARERPSLLLAAPYARLVYSPIRTYLLYKTLLTIAKGTYVGWNKLIRTGSVTLQRASAEATAK